MTSQASIIQLSENAIKHLKNLLARDSSLQGLRLAVKRTGCSGFAYDLQMVNGPAAEDIDLTQDGIHIFIDNKSVDFLRGTRLDFVTKSLGMTQWEFNNPNVEASCGCGESFSVRKTEADKHE
jgi:iron-sulfur cluster assembly accessory protein